MTYLHTFYRITILLLIVTILPCSAYDLPSLGDSTSSIVSSREEQITGQNWLRSFLRQAPISSDPLLYNYTYELIQNLAFHSPLMNKNFNLVLVKSNDFNAFAVPGNIIGINTGLFHYAETEDELSAVISHELAHLSQRHFARSLDKQKKQSITTLAALLGSLLIMAAGDGEAGMAAMSATQAASIASQLSYSRTQEEEADRIGMQTLVDAKKNPEAMANMFEHMLTQTRYRTDIKEFAFLLTHPLTESRVSEAITKARLLPKPIPQAHFTFELAKARAEFLSIKNPQEALAYFQQANKNTPKPANEYGLALSLFAANQPEKAIEITEQLYQQFPQQLFIILLKADALAYSGKSKDAITLLNTNLAIYPNNYALSIKAADIYLNTNMPAEAVKVLRQLVASGYPDTPNIWLLLAEVEGLAGNIAQVHLARAEYFVRIGALTQAQRHLYLALPLLANDLQAKSRAELRINDIEKIKLEEQF